MKKEQEEDKGIVEIVDKFKCQTEHKSINNRFVIINDLLYYISNADDEPITRLYIPIQLRTAVMDQYHNMNGHMGIIKVFNSIKNQKFIGKTYIKIFMNTSLDVKFVK